jgi:hypothetical protein
MRALVVASSLDYAGSDPDILTYELLDCPFIQQVAEYILDSGIRNLDFVLPRSFSAVREILGSGDRWGGVFRYFLVSKDEGVGQCLRKIGADDRAGIFLLARLDCLPRAPIKAIMMSGESSLFCCRSGQERTWTGWGILPTEWLHVIPDGLEKKEDLFGYLLSGFGSAAILDVEQLLRFGCCGDVLESNRRALSAEIPELTPHVKQAAPGIWIGRNVRIHPTAVIQGPVLIDENVRIGRNVRLGPCAVIGADCLVGEGSLISHSVICRGTYVGVRLDVKNALVNGATFVDTALGARIEGVDADLLGSVYDMADGASMRIIGESLLACAALPLGLPILFVLLIGVSVGLLRIQRRSVIKTPTVLNPACWSDFELWSFESAHGSFELPRFIGSQMPALIHVVMGRLRLAGPFPLTREELECRLPHERLTCTQEPAGVFRAGPLVGLKASLQGKSRFRYAGEQRKVVIDI